MSGENQRLKIHPKKSRKKSANTQAGKVSKIKHRNKRITKLAKQGKLRKHDKLKLAAKYATKFSHNNQKIPHTDSFAQVDEENEGNKEFEEKKENEIEEEDIEYFGENAQSSSFLDRARKKAKQKLSENGCEEQSFEKIPRKFNDESEKARKHLLPIKDKRGIISRSVEIEDVSQPENEGAEDEEVLASQSPTPQPTSVVNMLMDRQQQLSSKKIVIANHCLATIEDPQNNVEKLKELRKMLASEVDITVKKLLYVSIMEVYKDILPSYRIRLPTKAESQKVKKDTKDLQTYESALLKSYSLYLGELEIPLKSLLSPKRDGIQVSSSLAQTALACMCCLLSSLPHFNYRCNIISVIVPLMNSSDLHISSACVETVEKVFRDDYVGEVSLDIVKIISKLVKSKNYNVHPRVLCVLLHMKIRDVNKESEKEELRRKKKVMTHKEKLKKLSRADRKRSKYVEKVEKDLLEAEAVESTKKKQQLHTDIVKHVFTTYFRVIKKSPHSKLLSAVLEGLAKFAHLINVDFFDDLIQTLDGLLDSTWLTIRQILNIINTTFTILSGQGSFLNIDPHRFYVHMYKILLDVEDMDILLALRCIDLMLVRRRKQVSQQRILAFSKRLLTLAMKSQAAPSILCTVTQLMKVFPKMDILLDVENQGSGVYMPMLEDPEHCNAHNTSLWELSRLRRHYSVNVRNYVNHVATSCPLQGEGQLPSRMKGMLPEDLYTETFDVEKMFNIPKRKSNGKIRIDCNAGVKWNKEMVLSMFTDSGMSHTSK